MSQRLTSSRAELLSELEKCQSEMKVSKESHSNQLQALERENDMLREQLKKYVVIVQAQRRESSSAKITEGVAQMVTSSSGTSLKIRNDYSVVGIMHNQCPGYIIL